MDDLYNFLYEKTLVKNILVINGKQKEFGKGCVMIPWAGLRPIEHHNHHELGSQKRAHVVEQYAHLSNNNGPPSD